MKLTLCLADAASDERKGTLAVLGLGISGFNPSKLPAQFRGALVVIANPDERDLPESHAGFDLQLRGPNETEWQTIGGGEFLVKGPRLQVVMSVPILMGITAAGDYSFRVSSGDTVGEASLTVRPPKEPGKEPS